MRGVDFGIRLRSSEYLIPPQQILSMFINLCKMSTAADIHHKAAFGTVLASR